MWKWLILGLGILVVALGVFFFSAPSRLSSYAQFTIEKGEGISSVASALSQDGFVRFSFAFHLAYVLSGSHPITPGGYYLSPSENAFGIVRSLSGKPALVAVTIVPGVRKEQVAQTLATALSWSPAQVEEFIATDTDIDWLHTPPVADSDYDEGVYYPDSYLIPATSTPSEVAERLQAHFAEVFAPYAADALSQNIKWTTVLKVASILQREAAGPSDMPLISGILWNRLLSSMDLDVDSTVQYARGDTGSGWWAPLGPGDLQIQSPYNTYLHSGLPPTPISEPSLPAIEAALYPASTTCLYYLHDSSGQIHCSATYAGQEANIKEYLDD